MGEDLSEMWPNRRAKFDADWCKAPAEKSVTVYKKKATVNLVSRPYYGMAG